MTLPKKVIFPVLRPEDFETAFFKNGALIHDYFNHMAQGDRTLKVMAKSLHHSSHQSKPHTIVSEVNDLCRLGLSLVNTRNISDFEILDHIQHPLQWLGHRRHHLVHLAPDNIKKFETTIQLASTFIDAATCRLAHTNVLDYPHKVIAVTAHSLARIGSRDIEFKHFAASLDGRVLLSPPKSEALAIEMEIAIDPKSDPHFLIL